MKCYSCKKPITKKQKSVKVPNPMNRLISIPQLWHPDFDAHESCSKKKGIKP